jgi:hypothetical protein
MKRSLLVVAIAVALVVGAVPAHAKLVDLAASPNPAFVSNHVRHTVSLEAPARLDLYVSAVGFERPGTGTLPPGSWMYRCCPSQTAGTPAWFYRSNSGAAPGSYRFGAVARARGVFLSTAVTAVGSANVWIRIA